MEMGNDAIVDEIHRRGVKGVKVPVYQQGELVGTTVKYSDNLLLELAKSRIPSFKERGQIDVTFNADGATEELKAKLAAILASRKDK